MTPPVRASKKRRSSHIDENTNDVHASTSGLSKHLKVEEDDPWDVIDRQRRRETSTREFGTAVNTSRENKGQKYARWVGAMHALRDKLEACEDLRDAKTSVVNWEDSYAGMVEHAFRKGAPLHDNTPWPSVKHKASSQAIALLQACATAFDVLCDIQEHEESDDWTLNERVAHLAAVELLSSSSSGGHFHEIDVAMPKQCESFAYTLREELKVQETSGGILAASDGRTTSHIEAMIQAFETIKASFECCAEALHERVLAPLTFYTRGAIHSNTFPSNVYFVAWAHLMVQVASDLCVQECTRRRMEAYTGVSDFQHLVRDLTDKLYANIPSKFPDTLKFEHSGKYWSRDLMALVRALPQLKFSIPISRRFEGQMRRDVRQSEKFQKKLAKLTFDCICLSTNSHDMISLGEKSEFTDAIIEVLQQFKSHSVKLVARESLLKLNRLDALTQQVAKITKKLIEMKTMDESLVAELNSALKSLLVIVSIDPKELEKTSEIVPPLMNVFELRKSCTGSPNLEVESKLCAILACLAAGQSTENMRAIKEGGNQFVNLAFIDTAVQTAVASKIDTIGPIVCDLLRYVDNSAAVRKDKARVEGIGAAAIAALAMFVRRNEELKRTFRELGAVELLLGMLERKDVHCARIASAAILAMGEHLRLMHSLYRNSPRNSQEEIRLEEVPWDADALRRSLRAIAELIKDSPISLLALDDQITEIICKDWEVIIMTDAVKEQIIDCAKSENISYRKCEELTQKLFRRPLVLLDELEDNLDYVAGKSVKERNAHDGNLEIDRLYEDTDPTVDVNAHYGVIIVSVCSIMRIFKNSKPIEEITDVLLEVDTNGKGMYFGIIPPLLCLLGYCRALHENNLSEEKHLPGVIDVEKEACYVIGLLAGKTANQNRLVEHRERVFPVEGGPNVQLTETTDAVRELVPLLQRYHPVHGGAAAASVARRAADAITNLAHENNRIKNIVRERGGIPPLVKLLEAPDSKVQRAAASALRTLAFKNGENKNQIVECGALPTLIFMVRSEDSLIHKEAVGVIGNLVHSSPHIKRRVLDQGALQPVIELLKSSCPESQREAALLLGQFAARFDPPAQNDPDYRTKIVQRGAVQSLIRMLQHRDPGLREMAAFALGRLAQLGDNQVGICHSDALQPLLRLLGSEIEDIADHIRSLNTTGKSEDDIENEAKRFVENLQHNAAFALYGLAENKDNVPKMIKENAYMRLKNCKLLVPASEQCVSKTLKRLEERIAGDVLDYLIYVMKTGKPLERQRTALALSFLCKPADMRRVFLESGGLQVLANMLLKPNDAAEPVQSSGGSSKLVVNIVMEALRSIKQTMCKSNQDVSVVMPPRPSTPTAEEHMPSNFKDPELSDITIVVTDPERGKFEFKAHRIAFAHASTELLSMIDKPFLDSERMENGSVCVELLDVDWEVFEVMMDFVYTGTVGEMSSLRDAEFMKNANGKILQLARRFNLVGFKYLFEAEFIKRIDLVNFSWAELDALYVRTKKFDCKSIEEFILGHAIEHFDRDADESKVHAQVTNIVESFGSGIISYVESLLKRVDVVALESDRGEDVIVGEIA